MRAARSPVPDVGNNLFTFLGQPTAPVPRQPRLQELGLTNPVTLTTDANGVATDATFNTTQQKATNTGGGRNGRGDHRGAGHHNWWADFMPGQNGHV